MQMHCKFIDDMPFLYVVTVANSSGQPQHPLFSIDGILLHLGYFIMVLRLVGY
uniref:Uncharacterized protein n=1 Tax=Rhizophora mucronata TaxID=61149 RepID=A0A2P2IYI2_RHIMU